MTRKSDVAQGLDALLKDLLRQKEEYERTVAKCGIIGRTGTGKSSLLNAITGQKLAKTGASRETTKKATEYIHGGMSLWDLPGCGTDNFRTEEYVRKLDLNSYDFFIFVTADRFTKDDIVVLGQLADLGKLCFIVRNRFDQALANAEHDDGNPDERTLRVEITEDVRSSLRPARVNKIYMVSARKPAHYDLPELIKDIQTSFTGAKRLRVENDLAAWSEAALDTKRLNALRIVSWYAGLAAANGLNPVLGLDISVDLTLLATLSKEVSKVYGLSEEQERYWADLLKSPHGQAVVQRAVALSAKYGTEKAITQILKAIGKREIPKAMSKYIPFLGLIIGAGAGYALTYNFGSSLVDDYHDIAKSLLAELAQRTA